MLNKGVMTKPEFCYFIKFFCYISQNVSVLLINCENRIKEMAECGKFVSAFYESG